MPRFVIHVGPHKTGSTYLQSCFSRNRFALRERGIALPNQWEHAPGNHSHARLAVALRNGDLEDAARVLAHPDMREAATVLISAEDLVSLKAEPLQRLRALLGDAPVTIVYYVRRWSDLLPSAWQEIVKQGHERTLPEFLAENLRNPHSSQLFNLELRLAAFIDTFGRDSLRLVCYSALRDAGVDLFSHFARHFLAWPDAVPPADMPRANPSRDAPEVELLRVLNDIEFARTGQRSAALRVRFDAARHDLDWTDIAAAMEHHAASFMFNDAFPMLHRLHRDLHSQYLRSIVKPGPAEMFFRPMRRELAYVGCGYLTRPDVADAVQALHGRIMQ